MKLFAMGTLRRDSNKSFLKEVPKDILEIIGEKYYESLEKEERRNEQ